MPIFSLVCSVSLYFKPVCSLAPQVCSLHSNTGLQSAFRPRSTIHNLHFSPGLQNYLQFSLLPWSALCSLHFSQGPEYAVCVLPLVSSLGFTLTDLKRHLRKGTTQVSKISIHYLTWAVPILSFSIVLEVVKYKEKGEVKQC